jgi:predicted AAA+ superfamily ATPase
MERLLSQALVGWAGSSRRRPLVLRGARQAGKTWLVRDLASRIGRDLVEVNFERDPRRAAHFKPADPGAILAELSLALGREIRIDGSLLFLDEVQAAKDVLAKLRWFAEELPDLPVIAAGSLLDFALAEHSFSMPVGRISFLHVEPLGFHEYLRAHGRSDVLTALEAWGPGQPFSTTLHERALDWFRRYAMVGGMPAVVAADIGGAPARLCRELQRDLVATYRADFAKYAGRMDQSVIDSVLYAVARSLGRKFVYARVEDGVKQQQAKRALDLLATARLCHLVKYTAARGLPLGGEVKETFRKAILLDVGLFHALSDTPASERFPAWKDLAPAVRGQLTEQLAGQSLRLAGELSGDGPALYYWQREGGRPGEIDFVLQAGTRVVPVELKAGSAGAMKSLHQFVFDRSLSLALRLDENPPSVLDVDVRTTQGDAVKYRLLGLPLYLAWRSVELLQAVATR